ncbi:MAG: hypothetical protein CO099_04550 [Bdellovibrio sp. CG_4_9_14_3_um_filter_39_7]|nr:MAG: hypothetical protein CO099_04550 [Bdellovibrio sp. CG_4_9_14_3_um_filter_39_7]
MDMKLKEFVAQHPGMSIASQEDNESILNFFENLPMKGQGLQLSYHRSPDFFTFLSLQSNQFYVFIYREQNQILAVGSLSLRPAYINGAEQALGYLGDLRVRPQLSSTRAWRDFYNDLMQSSNQIDELSQVHYFVTAMIDSNLIAKKALVGQSRLSFQYNEISKYKMINLLGRYKTCKLHEGYSVSRTQVLDSKETIDFLNITHAQLQLGYTAGEWSRRSKFTNAEYVTVKKNSKIVGFTQLWSPSPFKKIIIEAIPLSLKVIGQILLSPRSRFRVKEEFKVLYLNAITVAAELSLDDQHYVFNLLCHQSWKSSKMKNYHCLAFADFEQHSFSDALKGFISNSTPMSLYQVVLRREAEEFKIEQTHPVCFDISLV